MLSSPLTSGRVEACSTTCGTRTLRHGRLAATVRAAAEPTAGETQPAAAVEAVHPAPLPPWPWGARIGLWLAGALVAGLCLWGLRETRDILNPVTILATAPDHQAIDWIQANLPQNARFFINVTPWMSQVYRGVDGGWWILTLTGRWQLLPPVVYAWGDPAYIKQVNDWAAKASAIKSCSADFWDLVRQARLNYIYLRKDAGALQPDGLNGCQGIAPVYQQNGVFIYAIQSAP